jgi:MerR family transcriptional regulator, thiopeptide resistance regulator
VMTMSETYEKYYSKEQLKELEERAKALGEERIRQAEAEWSALIDEVRAEMNRGSDPTSERVQALARRWTALVQEFTGGNPEISTSLNAMWQEETAIHGIDTREMRKMMAYVSKGMKASSS